MGDPDFVQGDDLEATRERVLEDLVAFVRALRAAGVEVPANAAIVAARALATVGFDDEDRARAALRAALLAREDDVALFEQLFPLFWRKLTEGETRDDHVAPEQGAEAPVPTFGGDEAGGGGSGADGDPDADPAALEPLEASVAAVEAGDDASDEDAEEAGVTASVYSPAGRREPIDVSRSLLRPDDRLGEALARLTDAIAGLRGRRTTSPGDERPDTRRALRRSFATGGTVLSVPHEERKRTDVRATMLVDVSQSVLDTIDRGFLIRFLRRARAEWRDVRIFLFDTDVREATEAFDAPSADDALRALDRAEAEWGGGTRIGHAIDTVRRDHPDAVDRETAVFVISDGLEVGEVDRLEEGMSWLSRRAALVLWCNPLASSPEYEPACRGMEASLPYVDGLFAFTDADDLAEMARQIEHHGIGGSIGYEHDPRHRRADD